MYRIDPWGDDWWQTARLCAVVNNSAGGKAREREFWPRVEPPQTPEEIAAVLGMVTNDMVALEKEKARRLGNQRR